jgi:glycosyltransferase involved in cell wall biosynthesis
MISVVFITRNRREELCKAIQSCINNINECFEIIVVDNNSTDNTQKIVIKLSEEFNFKLNYIYYEENLGVAAARNVGFSKAIGDIVFFLDDDAYIESSAGCIDEVCSFMRKNSDIAIVATDIYNVKENLWQHSIFPKGVSERNEGEVLSYFGASHFIKKDKFENCELYPKSLFYGSEELYASLVAWGKGAKVWYYKNMLVKHNPSSSARLCQRDIALNVLVNLFIVKKLILPNYLILISWIFFVMRIFKYHGLNLKQWSLCFELYRLRYDPIYRYPMSFRKLVELYRKFGWNLLI